MNFSMDVVVSDNGELYAFNDMTMNQGTSSKYYASAITKPYMTIAKVGKDVIKVDGEQEAAWEQAKEVQFQIRTGTTQAAASAKLLWDEQYLYVFSISTPGSTSTTCASVVLRKAGAPIVHVRPLSRLQITEANGMWVESVHWIGKTSVLSCITIPRPGPWRIRCHVGSLICVQLR